VADRPTICVDFEGVIEKYRGWESITVLYNPINGAADFLKKIDEMGDIIVWSHRLDPRIAATNAVESLRDQIEEWLAANEFPFASVSFGTRQPVADAYIRHTDFPKAMHTHTVMEPQWFTTNLERIAAILADRLFA
jgi:hypothetical protein